MSLWSADGKRQISGFPTGNRPVPSLPPMGRQPPKPQPFSAWNQTPNPFGQQYGGTFTPGGGAGNMAYAQPNQRPQPFTQNNTFGGRQFGNMGDAFAMRDAFVNQVNRTRNPFAQQWGQGNTTPQAMDFDTLMRQAGDAVQGGWANPFTQGQAQPIQPPSQGTQYGQPVGGRDAWVRAGRPGYDPNGPSLMVVGTGRDGTKFGTGTEAAAYDKWLQSQQGGGGATPAPMPVLRAHNDPSNPTGPGRDPLAIPPAYHQTFANPASGQRMTMESRPRYRFPEPVRTAPGRRFFF